MPTLTVTDDNFKANVLDSDKPVLVDFWAEWCGPCKAMSPALEELSTDTEGKAVIAKINIDDAMDTALNYNVRGVPALMIFKNGEVVAAHNGAMTKTKLAEWLADHS